MASSAPPAPPPPPPVLQPAKILANGGGSSKNSKHVVGVRPTQPQERSPFAGIYPTALRDAAAGLRKTQYLEPLLSREPQSVLRRPDQLADRRHWEDFEIDDPVDKHSTGESVYAPHAGPAQSLPVGVKLGHSNPISSSHHIYQQTLPPPNNAGSSYSYSSSFSSNQPSSKVPLNIPIRKDVPSNFSDSSNNSSYSIFQNNASSQPVISQPPASSAFNKPFNNTFSHTSSPSQSHIYQKPEVIINPQSYIRQYATHTPASSIISESSVSNNGLNSSSTKTTTSTYSYVNQSQPNSQSNSSSTFNGGNNFLARELRDSGLTERQKYSNQFQNSLLDDRRTLPNAIHNLYQETQHYTSSQPQDPVNSLINQMEYKMRTNYGSSGSSSGQQKNITKGNPDFCAKCGSQIVGDTPGVTALGNAFHVTCFACDVCQKQLAGCSFYNVDGKNLCQVDYMNSLEKCEKCLTPITQKILRAMGKPFHPECFACPACSKSLDGIPFTVDKENLAYCLDCYHERFSPRCAVCLKAIAPSGNETEVARVIAMDRSYHIDCYRCEDCGLKLNSKIEGQGCYPLENHLFCKTCNLNRLKTVT